MKLVHAAQKVRAAGADAKDFAGVLIDRDQAAPERDAVRHIFYTAKLQVKVRRELAGLARA